MAARAYWFGSAQPTNNTAEMWALIHALEHVRTLQLPGPVYVHGDSQLVVDFCRRVARPSQPKLFVGLRKV